MVMKSSKGRPESTNIEDHRPDDVFFQNLTPPFKPTQEMLDSTKGASQAAVDDATGILNDMQTMQRMQERAWVTTENYHSLEDMGFYDRSYTPTREKQVKDQVNNSNEFLLDTFKRARSVGYPIHPLMPYLSGQLPSTAFEGQAGK